MDIITTIRDLEEKIRIKKEQSKKLRSGFIKNISHEVRTPLNIILGFSDLLLDQDDIQMNKEAYLSQISLGCRKLVDLIERNEISSINGEIPSNEN